MTERTVRPRLTDVEYNLILENSCADLFATDGRGRIIYANDDSVKVLCCPLEKLLRVLENGEFRRVGGSRIQRTDVRIIAATNRDLRKMVEEKSFRNDLYYRLNVVPITIPPLRERPEDLRGLAAVFLAQFNRKHGKARVLLDRDVERLRSYRWPGNIRELRNVIERFVLIGVLPVLETEGGSPPARPASRLADFPQLHGAMHGGKVSFGIVAQLLLDPETDMAAAGELVDFMARMGLPVTMEEIGLDQVPTEELLDWCRRQCFSGSRLDCIAPNITPEELLQVIRSASAFGKSRKQRSVSAARSRRGK